MGSHELGQVCGRKCNLVRGNIFTAFSASAVYSWSFATTRSAVTISFKPTPGSSTTVSICSTAQHSTVSSSHRPAVPAPIAPPDDTKRRLRGPCFYVVVCMCMTCMHDVHACAYACASVTASGPHLHTHCHLHVVHVPADGSSFGHAEFRAAASTDGFPFSSSRRGAIRNRERLLRVRKDLFGRPGWRCDCPESLNPISSVSCALFCQL